MVFEIEKLSSIDLKELYVNKKVEIKCKTNGKIFSGYVYTIDPVSYLVVLIEFDVDSPNRVTVINANDILEMRVMVENSEIQFDFDSLFKQDVNIEKYSNVDIESRRLKLLDLLHKNHIPVNDSQSDQGLINIMDTVFIKTPFSIENCESTNEIVLNKITNLIKQLE